MEINWVQEWCLREKYKKTKYFPKKTLLTSRRKRPHKKKSWLAVVAMIPLNFTYFLSRKDNHQTGSSSFKDDDIVDDTDAKVNVKISKRRAGSSFTDYKDDKRGKPLGQCNI